jgi:hypothetical protein
MTDQNPILKVGGPLPQSMGRCADLYHDVRELRLAMEKEVDAIKARETEIQEHIINTLSVGDDTGAAGLKYRAQVVTKPKPRLLTGEAGDGWGIFTSWVRKNDYFHMLQKRINEVAVSEWQEAEQRIAPGLEMINVKSLSVTKI